MIPSHGPFACSGSSSLRTSASSSARADIRPATGGALMPLAVPSLAGRWQQRRNPRRAPVHATGSEKAPPIRWRVRAITHGASPSCQYWMLAQQWNCTMAGARGIRRPRDLQPRPGNPQFPSPRFPIWPGNGEGTSDSRLGRERESGNPPFSRFGRERESGSRLAANREIGDTLPCEYSRHEAARSWAGCCLESFKLRILCAHLQDQAPSRPPPMHLTAAGADAPDCGRGRASESTGSVGQ
jgi:hypothetical protein